MFYFVSIKNGKMISNTLVTQIGLLLLLYIKMMSAKTEQTIATRQNISQKNYTPSHILLGIYFNQSFICKIYLIALSRMKYVSHETAKFKWHTQRSDIC